MRMLLLILTERANQLTQTVLLGEVQILSIMSDCWLVTTYENALSAHLANYRTLLFNHRGFIHDHLL